MRGSGRTARLDEQKGKTDEKIEKIYFLIGKAYEETGAAYLLIPFSYEQTGGVYKNKRPFQFPGRGVFD